MRLRLSSLHRLGFQQFGLVLVLSLLAGVRAAGQDVNPHAGERIGTVQQVYDGALLPDIQVNTFRNIDWLFPTRTIRRGPNIYPLPASGKPLTHLQFMSRGTVYDLYDYVALNRVSGLLVLKEGQIAFETYQLGNHEHTRWMSMSIVKAMTATLIGAAIKDEDIHSLHDPITQYLPQLSGSAYEGVSVQHLLQRTSGVQWEETYTDPRSDRRRLLAVQQAQHPGGVLALMARLPRAALPGSRWNYSRAKPTWPSQRYPETASKRCG